MTPLTKQQDSDNPYIVDLPCDFLAEKYPELVKSYTLNSSGKRRKGVAVCIVAVHMIIFTIELIFLLWWMLYSVHDKRKKVGSTAQIEHFTGCHGLHAMVVDIAHNGAKSVVYKNLLWFLLVQKQQENFKLSDKMNFEADSPCGM